MFASCPQRDTGHLLGNTTLGSPRLCHRSGSHWPHVAIAHLKCGRWTWGNATLNYALRVSVVRGRWLPCAGHSPVERG